MVLGNGRRITGKYTASYQGSMKITYVYHSCFIMEIEDKVILFDPPGRGFLPKGFWEKIQELVKDRVLYIFVSHGHGDHYTQKIFDLQAKEKHVVLSDDIYTEEEAVMMSGEEERIVGDIAVKTFTSNDEGVAYLLKVEGMTIYYGGDLAMWDWPEWSESERREHVSVFEDTIRYLKKREIDIAFSNMDKRLKSWAGPVEFIHEVGPKYFVPMHTFGNEEWILDLVKKDIPKGTEIFQYRRPFDQFKVKYK